MAELTDAAIKAAEARGRGLLRTEPRASSARFDRAAGRIIVELVNGCSYIVPATLVQDLHGATDDDLALIEIDGAGFNLHWPALDADLDLPALMSGVFGTRKWMRDLTDAAERQPPPTSSQPPTAASLRKRRATR